MTVDLPAPAETLTNEHDTMRRLSIGRTKLLELLGERELESVKIGRRRLIVSSSIDRYIQRLRAAQAPANVTAAAS